MVIKKFFFTHINTIICVVLLHGKLNNKIIQDWVILFQHISFLISDFYGVENMPKKESFWTHLDKWWSVKISFLFDKLTIIPPYHLFLTFFLRIFLKSNKNMCLWIKIWFWNMLKIIIFAQLYSVNKNNDRP